MAHSRLLLACLSVSLCLFPARPARA
ncbi:MAG: hypothetical protein JWO31_297, partial [Phycisphaerales bacterium]|nr:hypothetical protein [Phycisphaerales bacterium]